MTAVSTDRRVTTRLTEPSLLVIAVAFSLLEGYDLGCFGVTVPSLLADTSLGFTTALAGVIGSITVLGMLVGAAASGATITRWGARRLVLISVIVFSAGMLICVVAPSAGIFAAGRAIVGIGLGVILPTLLGYVADLSRPEKRSRNIGITMSGYAIGGLVVPLIGAALLPAQSFRWVYLIGVIPALIALPFAARLFPESPVHLVRTGRTADAEVLTSTMGIPLPAITEKKGKGDGFGLKPLFQRGVWPATILFWLTAGCGLLLVFGIGTWLPTIMQKAGYQLGSALLLTAVMWTGAGVGMVLGGRVADALGAKPVVVVAFLIGSVSLVLMAQRPNVVLLLVLMFVSGFGFIGSQALVNAYILSRYPDDLRATGLSWALAAGRPGGMIGPLLGAWVLTSGLPVQWNFYAFAIVGAVGAVLAVLVPRIVRRAS
ncbi:MFS transporter [Rathayibacter sp. CAU 1779]